MGFRRAVRSAPLIAALLLAGACGGDPPPPPLPPVPAIDDARDARDVDPCSLLSADDAARRALPAEGTASTAAEGRRCEWSSGAVSLAVTLYVDGEGIARLTQNSESTTTRVRIEGYPALETFTERGGFCQYDVAVAPRQVVMAGLTGGSPDSCTALQEMLPGVLAALPPMRE